MNQQLALSSSPRNNDIEQPNEEQETSRNVEMAYSALTISLIIIILLNVFLILLISSFTFLLSFRIPILFISIIHLLYIIKMIITHHSFTNIDCCFQLIWGLSSISYYSCLIYFVEYADFQIQYAILQLFLLTVAWIVYQFIIIKRERNEKKIEQLVLILVKFSFVTQLLLINFKLVNWIDIKWTYTLSIIWVVLFIFVFLQTLGILNLTIKITHYLSSTNPIQKQFHMSKIIGIAWMNILFFGFSGVPFFTLLNICVLLDKQENTNFVSALVICILYILVYLFFTVVYKDTIVKFIITLNYLKKDYFQGETNQPPSEILSYPSQRNPNKYKFAFKKSNTDLLPKQMIKISSTYYLPEDDQRMNKTEIYSVGISSKQHTNTEVASETPVKQCFNCCQQDSCVVYIPCGHGGICEKCALDWFQDKKDCLICRTKIETILKISQIDDQRVKIMGIIAMN